MTAKSNEKPNSTAGPERLFPFALRSRILIVGRDTLARSMSKLHFILITEDLSENSRSEILSQFRSYPIVQHYTMEELQAFFGYKKTKVIGFAKSDLARSIYSGLKHFRVSFEKPEAGSPPKL